MDYPDAVAPNRARAAIREEVGAAAAGIALLNQTISATPSQAEVQAISDKVDELITALGGGA